jgi:hypothetical protein
MLRRCLNILVLMACLLPSLSLAADAVDHSIEQIERDLEVSRYQALAQVQADTHNQLAPFTTDGCSGGLSDGWRFLAKTLPAFKRKFGDKPPYESCCVEHDRAYWRGETVHGFEQRQHADQALQQCVAQFGKVHRDAFAQEFHLSPAAIERNFRIVAALMYRAVRVGGRPCTQFSWRWGYGWPLCREQDE